VRESLPKQGNRSRRRGAAASGICSLPEIIVYDQIRRLLGANGYEGDGGALWLPWALGRIGRNGKLAILAISGVQKWP
jgi:hypothetical protein